MKQPAVYILASERNGTLYTGMTTNLARRVFEHKSGEIKGFTQKYNIKTLVYYEPHDRIEDAALRERQIKKWERRWKLELIEKHNPQWRDLYETLL